MGVAARARNFVADRREILVKGGGLAALLTMIALIVPPAAEAGPAESVIQWFIDLFFGGGNWADGNLVGAAILWLIDLPDFKAGTSVDDVRATTTAAAFALLSLTLTASTIRFWLAGLGGGGGGEAVQGLIRTVGAAIALVAWPVVFQSVLQMADLLCSSLLNTNNTYDRMLAIFTATLSISIMASPITPLIGLLFVAMTLILFFALLAMKLVLGALLYMLYGLVPILIALWPAPGTDWMLPAAMRAWIVILFWPIVWAILFMMAGAMGADIVTSWDDDGILTKAIIDPLTLIVMFYLCIKVPSMMTKVALAGLGGGGGSAIRSMATGYAAFRGARAMFGAGGVLAGATAGGGGLARSLGLAAATGGDTMAPPPAAPPAGGGGGPPDPGAGPDPAGGPAGGPTAPAAGRPTGRGADRAVRARARELSAQMYQNARDRPNATGIGTGSLSASGVRQAVSELQAMGHTPERLLPALEASESSGHPGALREAVATAAAQTEHTTGNVDSAATERWTVLGSASLHNAGEALRALPGVAPPNGNGGPPPSAPPPSTPPTTTTGPTTPPPVPPTPPPTTGPTPRTP